MNKKIIIFVIIILIVLGITSIKESFSSQSLYDALPENIILIGTDVYEGYVNPNFIANSAIKYYKETNNKDMKVFKYSGLDINGNPIWGKYSSETNSYIEIGKTELEELENILNKKYDIKK